MRARVHRPEAAKPLPAPSTISREADGQDTAIEAWRGVAAWMVAYTHFWAFSGTDWAPLRLSHTGVNLFFVLSGFVFAPYLFGQVLPWAPHAVRRAMRLYPAYLAALAVYVPMKALEGQPLAYLWQHLSFTHVQSKAMAFYYNPPFWSLPAEVEFYMVLPLLAAVAGAARRRWGAAGPVLWLLLLSAGCGALRWGLGRAGDATQENAAFILLHHLPGLGVEFLLGAWAWRVSRHPLSGVARLAMVLGGLGAWWLLAVWYGRVGDAGVAEGATRGMLGLMAAACFAPVVAACAGPARRTAGARWMRPPQRAPRATQAADALARWAGRLSYGVYLFHIAALRAAEKAGEQWGWEPSTVRWAAVAMTLAVAMVVHRAVEDPLRRAGRRWARRLETRLEARQATQAGRETRPQAP